LLVCEVCKVVSVPSVKPGAFAEELKWVYTGSVTCKGPMPEIGTYREVKYLYVEPVAISTSRKTGERART
jgi:hypothetical protein